MPEVGPRELVIEKTPAYFVKREVPARVAAMNPAVKLVLVLRDPVTRALSGTDPEPSLNEVTMGEWGRGCRLHAVREQGQDEPLLCRNGLLGLPPQQGTLIRCQSIETEWFIHHHPFIIRVVRPTAKTSNRGNKQAREHLVFHRDVESGPNHHHYHHTRTM